MSRQRFSRPRFADRPAEPFASAEEAWLWFAACQLARRDGARPVAGLGVPRPCDPDDVYRAVMGLHARRLLGRAHLAVLGSFGARLAPPDPWAGDPPAAARLWAEALDRLATPLAEKGILR